MKCTSCGSENVVFMKFNGKWQCADCGAAFNTAPDSAKTGANESSMSAEAEELLIELQKLVDEMQACMAGDLNNPDLGFINTANAKIVRLGERFMKAVGNAQGKLIYAEILCMAAQRELEVDKNSAFNCIKRAGEQLSLVNPEDVDKTEWDYAQFVFNSTLCKFHMACGDLDGAKKVGMCAYEHGCLLTKGFEKATELALLLHELGKAEEQRENLKEAIRIYKAAADMAENAATQAEESDSEVARNALNLTLPAVFLQSLKNAGNAAGRLDDWRCSRECFKKAYGCAAAVSKGDERFMRELAYSLSMLGTAEEKLNNLNEAFYCHVQAIQISKELAERNPNQTKYLRDLGISLTQAGTVAGLAVDMDKANGLIAGSVDVFKRLVDSNPSGELFKDDLATTLYMFGTVGTNKRRTPEQKSYLKEAISIWTQLYNETSDDSYRDKISTAKKAMKK